MALDPRRFLTDRCPPKDLNEVNRRREFYQNIGNIGDLEILNEANGDIGEGLRTLRELSNRVRTNTGPVPNIVNQTGEAVLDAGADFVLDTLNLGARETRTQGVQFSPDVANRALGQARSIYDSVRNGQFDEFEDLPAAVQEFSNLERLLRGIFTPPRRSETRFKDICISPYAVDLVNRAPKHKFMFVVEFTVNEPYVPLFGTKELAFVVKRTSRPNISFQYEEINLYNFRSEVLKRHEYQPMNMTFYDDFRSGALNFWKEYLQQLSPLSRNADDPSNSSSDLLAANAMNYEDQSQLTAGTTSLQADQTGNVPKTILNNIKLYHVYQGGKFYDTYYFANPKITEMSLDDLDMTTSGEGTELSFTFMYDAVNITTYQPIDEQASQEFTDRTDLGFYPLTINTDGSSRAGG